MTKQPVFFIHEYLDIEDFRLQKAYMGVRSFGGSNFCQVVLCMSCMMANKPNNFFLIEADDE